MTMKLLLTEDDRTLGDALRAALTAEAYVVTWVRTAEDAQRFIQAEYFDLLLIDIVLPRMSGLDLLSWLRANRCDTPVMMLTARDAVFDRVLGLDSGADDYLPKPFSTSELLSRIRALLRRRSAQTSALWRVGNLMIDTVRRRASIGDSPVLLSQREYEILLRLAKSPGQVFTRRQLAVGSDATDPEDSNAVDVHIHGLRRKLGARRITTVRGVGYVLEEG
jgi:DNA-binding response OmpR family regulator